MCKAEPDVIEGRLHVAYHNWYGALASSFLREIRDHKRLMGTRCLSCGKVHMPPRSVCPGCFASLHEWVELPPAGVLLTYTLVNHTYSTYCQPREAPYYVGIVQLDGADTGLCHLLGELHGQEVRVGMRVEAVFREERVGNILDIAHFRPVTGGGGE
jgi:uncharacterized OB-fold protein